LEPPRCPYDGPLLLMNQVARAFASVADTLVTHPNVMNGASLYWPQPNLLYTEGYALDQFAAGRCAVFAQQGPVSPARLPAPHQCVVCRWGLRPLRHGGHRIGLVLDRAMEEDMRTRHLQVADGARFVGRCTHTHVRAWGRARWPAK
jgi:hypothetical protein